MFLLGFSLWVATGFVLGWSANALHAIFHPASRALFENGPIRLNAALALLPSILASICPAMLLANFLVYSIAPARRALEAEDHGHSGVNYSSSQRALSKAGMWIGLACLPFFLAGASIA